jgi:hypothetical protein
MSAPSYCDLPFTQKTPGQALECTSSTVTVSFGTVFNSPKEATVGDWGVVIAIALVGLLLLLTTAGAMVDGRA